MKRQIARTVRMAVMYTANPILRLVGYDLILLEYFKLHETADPEFVGSKLELSKRWKED